MNACVPPEILDNANAGIKITFHECAEKAAQVNQRASLVNHPGEVPAVSAWLPEVGSIQRSYDYHSPYGYQSLVRLPPRISMARAPAGIYSNCWTASCHVLPTSRWTIQQTRWSSATRWSSKILAPSAPPGSVVRLYLKIAEGNYNLPPMPYNWAN